MISTTNPRTGLSRPLDLAETTDEEVRRLAEQAKVAGRDMRARSRHWRAGLLEAIAKEVGAAQPELVAIADEETGLGRARLEAEVSRSIFQFRLFAEAAREGSYLEAAIDHGAEGPLGTGPDLRRMLIPTGPVAVFGASNFPFAFSVLGGDTASAVAAGCPVILKAHGSHPLTSQRSFAALTTAAQSLCAPEGVFGLVFGQRAGAHLVARPEITAVSLTGSLSAAKALQEVIDRREDPIPLYGELSSINPLVITPGAAESRGESIAEGLYVSFTGSAGQLCTKPGIAFVPATQAGDRLVGGLTHRVRDAAGMVLLNARIHESFDRMRALLVDAGARPLTEGSTGGATGFEVAPTLLTIDGSNFSPAVAEECFGPLLVVVRYQSMEELLSAVTRMPSSLTATVHSRPEEGDLLTELSGLLAETCGRLVYDGYPTGVRVSWAQHHGGPWPATNSQHTSVGVTAVRRFLRPFVWQNAPQQALPEELRDDFDEIPRRVDGVLQIPSGYPGGSPEAARIR